MNAREIAWRVFSEEFNSSTLDIAASEEKAPSYVVTPLGAKVNRLFVVGVITETENIGNEESPMIRARLADPTGNYYISAGQFQPEASLVLRELNPPEFVAVIGKARVYSPEDSIRLLSIRPELIRKCDAKLRDFWIYETAHLMRQRIEVMKEAVEMAPASAEELEKLGFPRFLAEGAAAAANHYDNISIDKYVSLMTDSLREAASDAIGDSRAMDDELTPPDVEEIEVSSGGEDEEDSVDRDEVVLQLVDSLDESGNGSRWDDIVSAAKKKRIDKESLEEICADLMDKGEIYEPELGRMKRI